MAKCSRFPASRAGNRDASSPQAPQCLSEPLASPGSISSWGLFSSSSSLGRWILPGAITGNSSQSTLKQRVPRKHPHCPFLQLFGHPQLSGDLTK